MKEADLTAISERALNNGANLISELRVGYSKVLCPLHRKYKPLPKSSTLNQLAKAS